MSADSNINRRNQYERDQIAGTSDNISRSAKLEPPEAPNARLESNHEAISETISRQ